MSSSSPSLVYFGVGLAFNAWSWHHNDATILEGIRASARASERQPSLRLLLAGAFTLAIAIAVVTWPIGLASLAHKLAEKRRRNQAPEK